MKITPIDVLLFIALLLIVVWAFCEAWLKVMKVLSHWKDGNAEQRQPFSYPQLDAEEWVRLNTIDTPKERYCPICGHDLVMVTLGKFRCGNKRCDVSQIGYVLVESTESMVSTGVENET